MGLSCAADILTGKSVAVDRSHRDLQHQTATQQVLLALEMDSESSASAGAATGQLDAKKVQGLLASLARLSHERSSVAHVTHPALCRFLRLVLAPVQLELGLSPSSPAADH